MQVFIMHTKNKNPAVNNDPIPITFAYFPTSVFNTPKQYPSVGAPLFTSVNLYIKFL